MRPQSGFGAASLAMLLAGCQPSASEPGGSGAAPDANDLCGAAKVSAWVGKPDSPTAREAIAKASGAKTVRWISPGMPVTMDYLQDRLNANIDDGGKYTRFDCA